MRTEQTGTFVMPSKDSSVSLATVDGRICFKGSWCPPTLRCHWKKKWFSLKLKRAHVELPHTSFLCVIRGRGKGEGVREKEHPASGNLRTQVSCSRKYLYTPLKKSFVPKPPPPPPSTSMEILLFLNSEIKVEAYKSFFFVFLLNLQPLSIYVLISFASTSLSFSVKILIMLFPITIKSPLFTSSV